MLVNAYPQNLEYKDVFSKPFIRKSIKNLGISETKVAKLLYFVALDEINNQFSKIEEIPSNLKKTAIAQFMFVLAEKVLVNEEITKMESYIENEIVERFGKKVLQATRSMDTLHYGQIVN